MDQRVARSARSKAALKEAFLTLLKTKDPDEITVTELCQMAGLNRSTFYTHYHYTDNLIREIVWDSVRNVYHDLGTQWELPLDKGGVDRTVIASYVRRFLDDPTLRRFCTCAGSERYRTMIIRAQVEITLGESPDPVRYYTAYFYNAGVMNFTLEWFRNGMPIPEADAVEIIHDFSKTMYR